MLFCYPPINSEEGGQAQHTIVMLMLLCCTGMASYSVEFLEQKLQVMDCFLSYILYLLKKKPYGASLVFMR